jgi:thioredoxin 2
MAGIVACPSCGKKNRVPSAASGSPVCAACKTALPWLVEATHDDLDAVLDTTVPVVVDLWAPWCGPCRMVAPILEQLAAERAGQLKIVKVNVDELPGVSARYGVQGIPTLLLLRHGHEVARQVGAAPRHALEQWLDTHVGQPR